MKLNVNVCDEFELTPMAYAAAGGHFKTVEIWLGNNADVDKQLAHKHLPDMEFAIGQIFIVYHRIRTNVCGFIDLGRRVKEAFKDMPINDKDVISEVYGWTPLYLATFFGHTDIVKFLLKQKSCIDQYNLFNFTPLYVATLFNHVQIVEILLEHGYNINICNEENESPLYVASKWGNVDIVKLLLDKNCDINICNKKRESPLHAASKCIGCLLATENEFTSSFEKSYEGTFFRYQDKKMKVSFDDYVQVVKCLLMRNADVNICNKDGKTQWS
ncbi:unnamed protein product [Mytilus coruscus]|uniref:Uncharacterized protein n=1 Tax=Mytilus coruscus TaxID=42192 RepID=A0A6J8AQV8_MYTCO|nr:unnamed protein product [Mytilus coruscus]